MEGDAALDTDADGCNFFPVYPNSSVRLPSLSLQTIVFTHLDQNILDGPKIFDDVPSNSLKG